MRDPSGDQAGSLPGPSRVTPPPSAAATSSRQAPKGPHTVTSSLVPSGDQRGGRLNAAKVRVRVTACSPANRNTASATPSVVRCQYARARPSGDQAGDAPCSPSGCRPLPSAPTTKRLSGPPTVVAREKARRSPSGAQAGAWSRRTPEIRVRVPPFTSTLSIGPPTALRTRASLEPSGDQAASTPVPTA